MMKVLRNIRDFLTEEQLKWLPGNLRVESCILLTQMKPDSENIMRTYLQIFDHKGTWIVDRAEPKRYTDHEILEAIETAIMHGVVFWDGKGECPFSGKRGGISLMGAAALFVMPWRRTWSHDQPRRTR